MLYFLQEDFDGLVAQLNEEMAKMRVTGREIGASVEGGDTFHDNFALEEAQRQLGMTSTRVRDLLQIKSQAQIVATDTRDVVSIGRVVTYEDISTSQVDKIKIGSYRVYTEAPGIETASYNTPLARVLMGGKIGEVKKGDVSGTKRSFRIISIE